MSQQTEAIRLAIDLKRIGADSSLTRHQAAFELRRLQTVNDALLEALESVLKWIDDNCETTGFDEIEARADVAIAKARVTA